MLEGEEFDADYFRFPLLQSCHNTLRINSQRIQITHYHYKSSLRFYLKTLLCALTRCDAHSDSQNDCGNWDFQRRQESTVLLQHNKPINFHNAFKISLLPSDTISVNSQSLIYKYEPMLMVRLGACKPAGHTSNKMSNLWGCHKVWEKSMHCNKSCVLNYAHNAGVVTQMFWFRLNVKETSALVMKQ